MKKIITFLFPLFLLGFIFIFTTSCKDDNTNYSTNDLQGVWNGNLRIVFHGGDNNGMDTTFNIQFTFGPNGTLTSMNPSPTYETILGNLNVADKGDITGTITTTHTTTIFGTPYTETTNMNWAGCSFDSKEKINVNMNWTWSNTNNNSSGYYIITGSLTK
jgi:hypothetical protein